MYGCEGMNVLCLNGRHMLQLVVSSALRARSTPDGAGTVDIRSEGCDHMFTCDSSQRSAEVAGCIKYPGHACRDKEDVYVHVLIS